MLLKLLQDAAKVLAPAGFDIEIVEKHHNQKVDASSGTALAMADSINEALDNEYRYTYDRSQVREKREKKEIGISAVRGGTIVGEHEVIFAGEDEVIEFKHTCIFESGVRKRCSGGRKVPERKRSRSLRYERRDPILKIAKKRKKLPMKSEVYI